MAELNINSLVERFKTRIGELETQLIIDKAQADANMEEAHDIIKQQQQTIQDMQEKLGGVGVAAVPPVVVPAPEAPGEAPGLELVAEPDAPAAAKKK